MNLSELEDDRHDEAGMVKANDGRRVVPVLGRTMREALLRARRAVGEKAVVVDHREQSGGVLLAVAPEVPRSPAELEELRGEARALLDAKQRRATPERAVAPVSSVPGRSPLAAVERSLRTTGVSRKLRERVLEAVAGRMTESAHPLDLAAEELGAVFSTASLPRDKRTTVIVALLGQTGVGAVAVGVDLGNRRRQRGEALEEEPALLVGGVGHERQEHDVAEHGPKLLPADTPEVPERTKGAQRPSRAKVASGREDKRDRPAGTSSGGTIFTTAVSGSTSTREDVSESVG